ncbi:hypothetical protein M513_07916 [Trichuris suis]|uniref:DUF7047 domain-containing protein n=1 Tax=Trichuris suis TaxID=68888 RepID=A0A085M1Q6_9BILA|nr:hypothetical protein M513_07916 [Trichuris suis]
MKGVLNCVLARDEDIRRGTSAYLDDILVNEDVVKASRVEEHLARYGLLCKPSERVSDGTRVLGLRVWGERDRLVWRRDTKVGDVPQRLSRRSVFSYCGRLTGHFPVCGWLRVAAAFLKRAVTAATSSWDEAVESSWLKTFPGEIAARMSKEDPVRGTWNVSGERARLWVDASALAIGAALEVDGSIVEDAAWLRPNDACHINMAEVDAAIKGLNLALSWNMKTVEFWVHRGGRCLAAPRRRMPHQYGKGRRRHQKPECCPVMEYEDRRTNDGFFDGLPMDIKWPL